MPDFGDQRVMACTRRELERWLGELTGGAPVPLVDGVARIDVEGLTMAVHAIEQPARRIALITIPRLEVRFEYPERQAQAARRWIREFDRHTQRGGG